MLLLFDIDLTLLTTQGSGMRAMIAAGRELFGPRFTAEGVDFAGRLDPLIIADLFAASGVPRSPDNVTAFRVAYTRTLAEHLALSPGKTALPGVLDLLAVLRQRSVTLGLLTGNFEATASLKLRACGIDPAWFPVRAWGDDSPNAPPRRPDLVPVAMDRHYRLAGRRPAPREVIVIGDTPHDIAAAKEHGCVAVAVATGRTPLDDLRTCRPDLALPDLTHAAPLLDLLGLRADGD